MTNEVTNTQDFIDSRDVQTRINDLEIDIQDIREIEDDEDNDTLPDISELEALQQELASLEAFKDEAMNCTSEWDDGATFINEAYFETYAREFAVDIGAVNPGAQWPLDCIDWAEAAEELKQDYATAEFDGQDFYVLSN